VPTAHKYVFLQKTELKDAKKAVEELILSRHCNPIVVRLAWHDSGSYDKVCRRILWSFKCRLLRHVGDLCCWLRTASAAQTIEEWPQRGGANGSIRFYPEIQHNANAGAQQVLMSPA